MTNPKCNICDTDAAEVGVIQVKGQWYCQYHYDEYLAEETFTCACCSKKNVAFDDTEAVQDEQDNSTWYCSQDCAYEYERECSEWRAHWARESHQSRFI